ncbi:adhesion G-protein coupled receptor D1-like [Gigantopelta aegis]|uniref:adhesion G-protein coupled receptor D1-like n=1 Tax=Gigantopelta aegis TaxID=1735272 RepID=UPI001B887793|nr:adhesion G-protein coupled receptor D1-like [Gigantopelta aegis]
MSIREDRHNRTKSNDSTVVNSDVLSTKILGLSENRFQDLKQQVVITFAYKNASLKESLRETCVFLNMSAISSSDRWSTNGCYVDPASNATHAICRCNHLTNFALLMDLYGTSKALDETNETALSAISYVGGCLSILACVLSIAVFEYFRLRNDRIRIHENLAASIICVQVVFLIGFGRAEKKGGIPQWACKTVAVLMHFFLTAMFCWMLVEGIHLYVALVRVFKRGNHLRKYLGIGWGEYRPSVLCEL